MKHIMTSIMIKLEQKSSIAKRIFLLFVLISYLASNFIILSAATSSTRPISGRGYAFDESTEYKISEAASTSSHSMHGTFSIMADVIEETTKNGITGYVVKGTELSFSYNYTDSLLKESDNNWFLANDDCKSVDGKKLDSKVQKGLILLQISKDRTVWNDVYCETNAFEKTPIRTGSFYKATDIQLMNGCYYKLTIAYELQKKNGKNFLGVTKYEYKRYAEVYEVYVQNDKYAEQTIDLNRVYYLGSKIRTADFDSYSGIQTIDKSDPHYGWDIGKFFISGHTNTVKDSDGTIVIMKNVGDEITLWFNLEQNINALNGNSSLSINTDDNWYDRDYETERTNSGKGVLIVKHTDYKNSSRTVIYTDYLLASASVGSNTKVQIFEEGDYEVSLDYEIREDELVDKYYHYKISFKFLIRNGNCMVYPLDLATGGELTNGALTESGFTLDLAKSRYLNIVVKKEVLAEGADGLVEDTRFNKIARDGEKFDEEGIYTITVKNLYSGADATTKKIYVGTNPVLRAFVVNPQYSIAEINNLVSKGATIDNQGIITIGGIATVPSSDTEVEPIIPDESSVTTESPTEDVRFKDPSNSTWIVLAVIGIVLMGLVICSIIVVNKKRQGSENKGGSQN